MLMLIPLHTLGQHYLSFTSHTWKDWCDLHQSNGNLSTQTLQC